jgi:hypothetical protein
MARSAIKLTRDQREAIYHAIRTHLVGLSDVFTLLERQDDVPAAEKLAREFADDFRLLEDIGWHEDGSSSQVELTMPHPELSASAADAHGPLCARCRPSGVRTVEGDWRLDEHAQRRSSSPSRAASRREASISTLRIETLSTLSPNGTPNRRQNAIRSMAVATACS